MSIAFSVGVALTRRPWCDEGWFASPPYNLIHHGNLGMTILDPHGFIFSPFVKGIDQFTYWVLPGYLLFQAFWYQLFGLSLLSMRLISVVWSVVALMSFFTIVDGLTRNRGTALLATLLLATEQHFILGAATGRMDVMCAALGLLSVALYLCLRDNLPRAIAVSSIVSACALFTHPNAVFSILTLFMLAVSWDRRNLNWRLCMLAAAPFLVLSLLWSLYVSQSPASFLSQMAAQNKIPHRLELQVNLVAMLRQEFALRYANAYGFLSHFPLSLVRGVVFAYSVSVAAVALIPSLRRSTGARWLLTLLAVHFVVLTCFQKNWYYLIYILPFYTALLAVFANWMWQKSTQLKIAALAGLIAVVSLHLGVVGARIWHNDYRHRYLAAANYLRQHASPDDLIVGSGELGFQLGYEGRVLDDCRLGLTSGSHPRFIVIEAQYAIFWWNWLAVSEPATYRNELLLISQKYRSVYNQRHDGYPIYGFSDQPYEIFERRDDVASY